MIFQGAKRLLSLVGIYGWRLPENLRITDHNRGITEQGVGTATQTLFIRLTFAPLVNLITAAPKKVESNSCIPCHSMVGYDT